MNLKYNGVEIKSTYLAVFILTRKTGEIKRNISSKCISKTNLSKTSHFSISAHINFFDGMSCIQYFIFLKEFFQVTFNECTLRALLIQKFLIHFKK